MKKTMLIIITFVLIVMLTACAKSQASHGAEGGAEPAEEFETAEEAAEHIKKMKAAGVEETVSPNHVVLYDKEQIYALKEVPLAGFEQSAVMLVMQGTAITYRNEEGERAAFFWNQGYGTDEMIGIATERYGLKRYADTEYFIGKEMDAKIIIWWENGDQFLFEYPAETGIDPSEVIENIEVEKYDV